MFPELNLINHILANLLAWLLPCVIAMRIAWNDWHDLTIAHKPLVALLIAFPILSLTPMVDFWSGLLAGAVTLAIGFFFYGMRWWGGGDAKLATCYALYLGWGSLCDFFLITALGGGVLAMCAIFVRRARKVPVTNDNEELLSMHDWRDRIAQGQNVLPYGVALTGALVCLLTIRFYKAYWSLPT
jgi:prepilin peptidase CpaA